MAYPYRTSYGGRDETCTNNSNRLGGGMTNGGDPRGGGLVRRFTTNALPTLSPIGQQRRQAAGDTQMVSTFPLHAQAHLGLAAGGGGTAFGGGNMNITGIGGENDQAGLRLLVMASEPSPGGGAEMRRLRGKGKVGAVGEERAKLNNAEARSRRGLLHANNDLALFWLTSDDQSVLLNRATPVSLSSTLCLQPPHQWLLTTSSRSVRLANCRPC